MSDMQINGTMPPAQILNVEQNVVATLEMLLGMAKAGRLWGVAVATAEANGLPGKYAAIGERVSPVTLLAMSGCCLSWAMVCNAEADRKMTMVRPTGLLKPNGQQAMASVSAAGG